MDEPFLLGKFIPDDVINDNDEILELEFSRDETGSKPVQTRQIVTVDLIDVTSDVIDLGHVTSDVDSVVQIPTEESLLGLPESIVTGRTDFGERTFINDVTQVHVRFGRWSIQTKFFLKII